MPDNIIVGQLAPSPRHPGCLAQRCCVKIAEYAEGDLSWKGGEEVNPDELANIGGEEGELRKTALREDSLEHEVSVF